MATHIHLLGPPSIVVDGQVAVPPRGSKSWCLLAYLLLTRRPVPRSRLAALLFEEAADPAGALRWTLSQVRRALGPGVRLDGDPLTGALRDGTVVDVDVVAGGSWREAVTLPGFGRDLLEGVPARVGPAFELWLATERRRIAGTTQAMLHEAAHARLADGDAASAAALAAQMVGCDVLDEAAHELLVRSLVAAGDLEGARAQVARCQDVFRRELGVEPSPAVSQALRERPVPALATTRGAVLAQVDTGTATAHAGAYDAALPLLRSAVAGARQLGQDDLLGPALAALGAVLVQGVRGADEEGVGVLHEAVVRARRTGDRVTASKAAQEIGHVEVLRARYPRMEVWFREARELADGDPQLLVWAEVHAALGRTDQGDYAQAAQAFERALALAEQAGDRRALAYALTGLGRQHLLRHELPAARELLVRASDLARQVGYTSFVAFPESLLGEVHLLEGDLTRARETLEHSYAMACQVGDPCWESYSLRARGLLAAATGDEAALELLEQARRACGRAHDTHDWVQAHCLEALCAYAVERGLGSAAEWVDELDDFASRRGMRELVARAAVHRLALGQPGAQETAALLVETVDNPWLHALHTRVSSAADRTGALVSAVPTAREAVGRSHR